MGRVTWKVGVFLLMVAVVFFWGAGRADAAFQIRFDSGGDGSWEVTITDNLAGDTDPTVGKITIPTQTIGVFTNVGGYTSSSHATFRDQVSTTNIGLSGMAGDVMVVEVQDTGYTLYPASPVYFTGDYWYFPGGTGVVDFTSVFDDGTQYTISTLDVAPSGSPPATPAQFLKIPASGAPFSLTQTIRLDTSAAGGNSFTYTTTAFNPEPASLLAWSLLAGVFGGLGWWRRRRHSA